MAVEAKSPYGVSSDASVGLVAWTCAAGDLENDDGTESSATLGDSNQTHYLTGLGCGFAIPADATINGVLVTVTRRVANGSGGMYPSIRDAAVRLAYLGAVYGDDKADTGTDWPVSELQADYGGTADTWGVSLTPAIINHASFGIMLSINATGGALPDTAYVDRVVIQVTYTVAVVSDPQYGDAIPPRRKRRQSRVEFPAWDLDPPAAPAETDEIPDDPLPRRRAKKRRPIDAIDAALLSGPAITTDQASEEGESEAILRRPRRRKSRPLVEDSLDVHAGVAACDCAPAAAVVLSEGFAAVVVSGAESPSSIEPFAVVIVSEGYGSAAIVERCDC